ncbi:hypothetical protein QN277_017280 [Acacia crassicarpa]|uniref:Sucrose synthase N-terminal domain-containing protein n=1 Tax=Acacia crassicarpa TaxID=499986 RepID=A0AAE1MQB1_9FABA|nr:hypothetical protein QN277_017280 [Acacia crassicarpa]
MICLLSRYVAQGKGNLLGELEEIPQEDEALQRLKDSSFVKVLESAKKALVLPPFVYIAIRPRLGV